MNPRTYKRLNMFIFKHKKNKYILFIFLFFYQLITAQTAPVAVNDSFSVGQNTTLVVDPPGVLFNDTDADADTLSVTQFTVAGSTYNAEDTASFVEGQLTLQANGGFTFIPAANYYCTVPPIEYEITDSNGNNATAILTITINNTTPTTKNDYDTADVNETITVGAAKGVLINDADSFDAAGNPLDVDGNPIFLVSYTIVGAPNNPYNAGDTASVSGFIDSFTLNADGSYSFTPAVGYTGNVPMITYTISDGCANQVARLFLTVEPITDLLEVSTISTCNQGYTADGEYKISYNITISNKSTAREAHASSIIENIDIINDLDAIFGAGCVKSIDVSNVETIQSQTPIYPNDPVPFTFPLEFNNAAINPSFSAASSNNLFSTAAISSLKLYPRQSINMSLCYTVDASCAGSGIDFNNIVNISSTFGGTTGNSTSGELLLEDFHTTQAVVSAGLYIPKTTIEANADGTFTLANIITITNEGTAAANDVNYNMGLGDFLDKGITFTSFSFNQVSGPNVTTNTSFDGNTDPLLLTSGNSLPPSETIVLEVVAIGPISSVNTSIQYFFPQMNISQTQGIADGFDETLQQRNLSYVLWSDSSGNHLDRYYTINSATETTSASLQCTCLEALPLPITFQYAFQPAISKTATVTDRSPGNILEHEEITFTITFTNRSPIIEIKQIQIEDVLSTICPGNIVSVSDPVVSASNTSVIKPKVDPWFKAGVSADIFNDTTTLLKQNESITVEFKVVFNEDCINSTNKATLTILDPVGFNSLSANVTFSAFTDTDADGVSNVNDLDDDNDTLPDTNEYNGLANPNPLEDHDGDRIPNYRDTDFGPDANTDGIVDIFDFDNDGVPNHFDLDSDNDGIFDIVESSIAAKIIANLPTNNSDSDGKTNNPVGANGLDNTLETNNTSTATINYTIPNTDGTGNFNFLDIDADGDGIVDNIEVQVTGSYIPPNNIVTPYPFGIDTAYPNGLTPVNTDSNTAIFGTFTDTLPDYIDTNSDNDIKDDNIEGWDTNNDGTPETVATGNDADNDGLDDAYDTNVTLLNPSNGQTPESFPNIDNADTPERDWREINAVVVLIENDTATEGNDLEFNMTLVTKNDSTVVTQSAFPIIINYTTQDGTATTSLNDYNVATEYDYSLTSPPSFTFPVFTETAVFAVPSVDDTIDELDEFFTLTGKMDTNPLFTINTEITAIGGIIDNDDPPNIRLNSSKANEGDNLQHTIELYANPSSASPGNSSSRPTEITIATRDGTAVHPFDYTSASGLYTIPGTVNPAAANTETSFVIATLNDNLNEADEENLNVIGSVTTNNIGNQDLIKIDTIVDIDPFPALQITDTTVVEGNELLFTISLVNTSLEPMQNYLPIEIDLQTFDITTSFNDFVAPSTPIIIPAFAFSILQNVSTVDDKLNEVNETMELSATSITTIPSDSTTATGVGTIEDNDFPNLFSPNGDGVSDVFKILDVERFPNFTVKIIDRWGNEVYDYNNNGSINPVWWDGTYKGKPVPEGVYFYYLDFKDGITKPRTNFIQLTR